MLQDLLQLIMKYKINSEKIDKLVWRYDRKGSFSVSFFVKKVQGKRVISQVSNYYSFTCRVWKGLVPPKVELLTWFLLIGRINTKER